MNNDRIAPLGNLAFRKVFSSNANKDILAGLIHDFFGFTPEKITIKKPYSIKTYREEYESGSQNIMRYTEKDIAASLEGADFIAEAQIRKDFHFEKRASYYLFDAYCDNYNGGRGRKDGDDDDPSKYEGLCPVYSLNILQDSYYRDERPLRIFELYDRVRHISPDEDPVHLAFFELKKHNESDKAIEFWRQYFLSGEAPVGAPAYIAKAAEIIRVANLDKEEREMQDRLERAIEFNKSMIMQDHLDWKNEGRKEGKIEDARGMKREKIATATIARITGLSVADIKKL